MSPAVDSGYAATEIGTHGAEDVHTRHHMRYEHTIDWDDYWSDADETARQKASPSAHLVREPFAEFLAAVGPPASYADVGCGGGHLVFDAAEQYPDATVVGYDAAPPVVEANRERAAAALEDPATVRFEQATLPDFDPDRQFEVVSCFYTLCYVAEVEEALQALYDAVEPGGALAIGYHNSLGRSQYQRMAAEPAEEIPEGAPFDPETFEDRFELLLAGENLLSHERIHDVLGTWPQSLYSVCSDAERHPAWRHNPYVYVPK